MLSYLPDSLQCGSFSTLMFLLWLPVCRRNRRSSCAVAPHFPFFCGHWPIPLWWPPDVCGKWSRRGGCFSLGHLPSCKTGLWFHKHRQQFRRERQRWLVYFGECCPKHASLRCQDCSNVSRQSLLQA